jgi:hypothetical protein
MAGHTLCVAAAGPPVGALLYKKDLAVDRIRILPTTLVWTHQQGFISRLGVLSF